ncbi:MAG: tetratricopeptide repeat protein [Deltaproteobacteria bacterium]|nr:tetratricopeptide repeat protein [Deltaproteobacteria bacterium]
MSEQEPPKPIRGNDKLLDPKKDPLSMTEEELTKVIMDPSFTQLFTIEKVVGFLQGKLTYAEMVGMTAEEAYAIADVSFDLFEQGKYDDAKSIVEALVIANPYDATFHNLLASIYAKKEMWEEAFEEYSITIELDKENIGAYVNRAEILLQHGEMELALDDLTAAVQLDPESEDPYGVRARALATATLAVIEELLSQQDDGKTKTKPKKSES